MSSDYIKLMIAAIIAIIILVLLKLEEKYNILNYLF